MKWEDDSETLKKVNVRKWLTLIVRQVHHLVPVLWQG
jgi:hypothetical protein